jgi:hypothetical protein
MHKLRALAVLAVMFDWTVLSTRLSAECITIPMTLAERLKVAPLVFVADVVGVEVVPQPESYGVRVRFRVIEAYKGIETGEQALSFRPTAEDFKFEIGQRVLVYTAGAPDSHWAQCSTLRTVTLQDPELQELRRLVRK